jgi:hypothetical protein
MTQACSQSQTKQQPAGDGRALLPFVPGERELWARGDARLSMERRRFDPRLGRLLRPLRPVAQRLA